MFEDVVFEEMKNRVRLYVSLGEYVILKRTNHSNRTNNHHPTYLPG